jgi:hypothetical protein
VKRADGPGRGCRGGALLEVLLSLALFVGAATFALAALRSVMASMHQSQRLAEAVDLARSRLAELEAGLISIQELRGPMTGRFGSMAAAGGAFDESTSRPRWTLEVRVERTRFTGLSLVELTVRESPPAHASAISDDVVQFTLRQLMTLREQGGDGFEPDSSTENRP